MDWKLDEEDEAVVGVISDIGADCKEVSHAEEIWWAIRRRGDSFAAKFICGAS